MLERRLSTPKLRYSKINFQGECTFNMAMLQVLYEIDQGSPFDDIALKLDLDSSYLDEITDHLLTHNIIEYFDSDDGEPDENALAKVYQVPFESQSSGLPSSTGDSDGCAEEETDKASADFLEIQFNGMGITGKLIVIMLFASMIPLLGLWTSSYARLSSQISKETEMLMQEKAFGLTSELNEWIDKNKRVLYAFSKTEEIVSMDPRRQTPALKLIRDSNPWISHAFTLNNYGINIARSDDRQLMSYKDRGYFMENLGGKNLAWQTVTSNTDSNPFVVFSTPIRRKEKIIGVLGIAVDMEHISKHISDWCKGQTGFAFLLDEHQKVISHQVPEYVEKENVLDHEPLITAFENGEKGLIRFENKRGVASVGVVSKAQLGWLLAVQQEERYAFAVLIRERYYIAGLLAAAIGLVLVTSWFAGQAITKPIKELTSASDRISLGDSSVSIDTCMKGELGVLAGSIARMNESVHLALTKLRTLRNEINQPVEN